MKKRLRLALLLASACALLGIAIFILLPREPAYGGKTLTEWVQLMLSDSSATDQAATRDIVRHLGTNSVPTLLRWLHDPDTFTLHDRITAWRYKLETWLDSNHLPNPDFISPRPTFGPLPHREVAVFTFQTFDSANRTAVIPKLVALLGEKDAKSSEAWGEEMADTSHAASATLFYLAPESINPLIACLTNQNEQIWTLAAEDLAKIGAPAKDAVPNLEKHLDDKNPKYRIYVAMLISNLGGDPERLIPTVIQLLPQLNPNKLTWALPILLSHKNQALPAVPALLAILQKFPDSTNPTNTEVRAAVISALQQIDPATAAKLAPP